MLVKPGQILAIATFVFVSGCAGVQSTAGSPPAAGAGGTGPAAVTASPSPATELTPAYSTQIVPGDRFGPITETTTREQLAQQFGAANLRDAAIDIGEGETAPGTVVNLGSERSFTVLWKDDNRTGVEAVTNPGTAWKTPEGIGIGTSFSELQQKLGPFQVLGFAWDYGGTILLEGTNLARYEGVLILRVQPDENLEVGTSSDYQAVTGEEPFPSNNPHLQRLNLTVKEMIVALVREEP